jgi:hypothetical protein
MMFALTNCSGGGGGGSAGSAQGGATMGGSVGSGGATSTGGTSSASSGGASAGGSSGSGGSGGTGTKGSGGASAAGGSTSAGGSKATGGTTSAAGAGGSAGRGGSTSTGGGSTGTGGVSTGTGGVSTGGTSSAGGAMSTGGVHADSSGVALAKPGDSTSTSKNYLNLGDMRLLCNRWGSDAKNCSQTQLKMSVNSDSTIGYDFNRGTCDSTHAHPDYPEVEFGVAPFGAGSSDLTSPPFSSTALLPIQLSSLSSASVTLDSFNSTYQKSSYYDTNFEFWISKQNPLTSSTPGVYAEIIVFLDWDNVRESSTGWQCENLGTVTAGSASYKLCHQEDNWGSGWRFFNFELNGQQKSFSGKADIKAILDYVKGKYNGFTTDMWLTRIEVGTEVDDDTQGTAKINNLTFEINGTSKSIELAK